MADFGADLNISRESKAPTRFLATSYIFGLSRMILEMLQGVTCDSMFDNG